VPDPEILKNASNVDYPFERSYTVEILISSVKTRFITLYYNATVVAANVVYPVIPTIIVLEPSNRYSSTFKCTVSPYLRCSVTTFFVAL
jgi:hypothetical protein